MCFINFLVGFQLHGSASKINQQRHQKKAFDVLKSLVEFAATCIYFGAKINNLVQRVKYQLWVIITILTLCTKLFISAPKKCKLLLVSRSQTPPLFDIWTAGRESGALALKLSFRVLPMTSLVISTNIYYYGFSMNKLRTCVQVLAIRKKFMGA